MKYRFNWNVVLFLMMSNALGSLAFGEEEDIAQGKDHPYLLMSSKALQEIRQMCDITDDPKQCEENLKTEKCQETAAIFCKKHSLSLHRLISWASKEINGEVMATFLSVTGIETVDKVEWKDDGTGSVAPNIIAESLVCGTGSKTKPAPLDLSGVQSDESPIKSPVHILRRQSDTKTWQRNEAKAPWGGSVGSELPFSPRKQTQ